jgi:hypothetical protein
MKFNKGSSLNRVDFGDCKGELPPKLLNPLPLPQTFGTQWLYCFFEHIALILKTY